MKLQISSYNNTGATWNAEAEETSFLHYKLRHRFNYPAEAICVVADTNGTKAQKYNVDADDVYIGPAKVTVEHPDATDVFYGRIVKAEPDSINRTVTLFCRDWLDQLNEKRITYDMREKITGNIRQSGAHTDPDNTKVYLRAPVARTLYSAQADDGGVFTDETAAANNITTNDMTLLPAVPAVDDAYYFGFESTVSEMYLYISTQGNWVGTTLWQYWNGAAWSSLGRTDPTNAKWTFESAAGLTGYAWTVPGDWATCAVNGVTAYYIRAAVQTYTGITTQPKGAYAFAEYYLYDDGMAWAGGTYDGMFVCFVDGESIVTIWPYDETVTPTAAPMATDAFNTDIEDLWNDNANGHSLADTASYQVDYKLRPLVQVSSFFTSQSKAEITIKYYLTGTGSAVLGVYDYNASTLRVLGDLPRTNGTIPEYKTYKIPAEYLPYFYDADGEANININVTVTAGTVTLKTFELKIDSTVIYAIGTNAVTISGTEADRLRLAEDITHEDGSWGIWEQCQYSIAKYIYQHLESATGIINDSALLVALTHGAAQIENTAGISLRQYVDRTRLEVWQDLCNLDKAVFWMALGTVIVTHKSTFNSGAPTAMTDASVEGWRSVFDYETMVNEFKVYGIRKNDIEVYQNVTDATSIAKYGATRTQVIRNSGLVTQRDALALGTSLIGRDANVQQMLYASIAGLDSTFRLGTEVSITSTYLGLTAANYIVSEWTYDSQTHKTGIVLHPRVSQTGLMSTNDIREQFAEVKADARTARGDQYIPEPMTNEVA